MKSLITKIDTVLVVLLIASASYAGIMKDFRDGKTYRTVRIGKQVWMAENLKYKTSESKCYDNKPSNCNMYGRLYSQYGSLCPKGWHLPADAELTRLIDNLGTRENIVSMLNILPAGYINSDSNFAEMGRGAYFWGDAFDECATGGLNINDKGVSQGGDCFQWRSVRCVEDYKRPAIDKHKIPETVNIRGMIWMTKDLVVRGKNRFNWVEAMGLSKEYLTKEAPYHNEVVQGLCPSGWRIPSRRDLSKTFCGNEYCPETDEDLLFLEEGERYWTKDQVDCCDGPDERAYGFGMKKFITRKDRYSVKAEKLRIRCVRDERGDKNYDINLKEDRNDKNYDIDLKEERNDKGNDIGLKDRRDGKIYKTVKIGVQTWMAENLNYDYNHGTAKSFCYENEPENCDKYGRLYAWRDAVTACPAGWHLPSKKEFETLLYSVGGENVVGTTLKFRSGWVGNGNGIDKFGFGALPAGYCSRYGVFRDEGYFAYFWSSTEYDSYGAYRLDLYCSNEGARLLNGDRYDRFSVRCVKD